MPVSIPTGWNPAALGSVLTLDPDGVTLTKTSGAGFARSLTSVTTGKWYVEMLRTTLGTWMPGLSNATNNLNQYPGQSSSTSIGMENGTIYGGGGGGDGALATTGWIGLAIDADARTLTYSNAVASATTSIPWSGAIYLAGGADSGATTGSLKLNAGQTSFAYTVPSGYTAGFAQIVYYELAGNVLDDAGAPAQRAVWVLRRDTMTPIANTLSDATTGDWSILTAYTGEVIVLCLDDASGTQYNLLAFDKVVAV
jgi:hypothetical protein